MLSLDRERRDIVILVADDEPDNLVIISKAIRYLGGIVYCATNGREALGLLDDIEPTVILLDLSMPQMNGWETLQAVKSRPHLKYVPVIALTAHAMTGDKEKALNEGFSGYIAKPFRPSRIVEEMLGALMTTVMGA